MVLPLEMDGLKTCRMPRPLSFSRELLVDEADIVLIPLNPSFLEDGTDESLIGVLSIVLSTSSWRFDRSCLPVLARHKSGLARGGPPAEERKFAS